MTGHQKVVFLDRDGTINIDHGYVHKVDDWEFTDKAIEALQLLDAKGYMLAVVTNQAGIADQRYTSEDVETLHDYVSGILSASGIKFGAIAYCPHHRDGDCDCRKPKPGLALSVENAIGPIDYENSWVVGDKESDVGFGKNIGCKTALIRSRYWKDDQLGTQPDIIISSLFEFAMKTSTTEQPFDDANWRSEKILTASQAADVARELRAEGLGLVTVNGSFDLVHAGHLDLLEEARQQGDALFVGMNTDRAIADAKGPDRPLIPEQPRAAMLAALTCVDYVVLMTGSYSEEPMLSLLETVQPVIHVNGPDYGSPESWVEWPTMQKFGTQGHRITKRNDFSTSMLVAKIRASGSTTT